MNGILAIAGRELRSYFVSPLGWIVTFGFLVLQGISFLIIMTALVDPRSPAISPFEFLLQGFFFWLILLFIAPVLTMRLLAEERRSGTVEVLMTSPITETQVVLGKYLAALAFYTFLWSLTGIYGFLIGPHLNLDLQALGTGYLGVVLVGSSFLAAGLFASALTRNQIISAVLAFALGFTLFAPSFLAYFAVDPLWKAIFEHADIIGHMEGFTRGIVDTRPVIYHLSLMVFFLFLSTRAFAGKKWS